MRNERIRRLARLEKRELAEIPSHWSKEEQGQYLWRLLQDKGVDPSLLYTVEYFPSRRCWLLTQECESGAHPRPVAAVPPHEAGQSFYTQVSTELQRTALAAFAAHTARSVHFAHFGRKYELPPKPQETTLADLVRSLGGPVDEQARIRFTSEGGWQAEPPENGIIYGRSAPGRQPGSEPSKG
jgi:hypothetical protein